MTDLHPMLQNTFNGTAILETEVLQVLKHYASHQDILSSIGQHTHTASRSHGKDVKLRDSKMISVIF